MESELKTKVWCPNSVAVIGPMLFLSAYLLWARSTYKIFYLLFNLATKMTLCAPNPECELHIWSKKKKKFIKTMEGFRLLSLWFVFARPTCVRKLHSDEVIIPPTCNIWNIKGHKKSGWEGIVIFTIQTKLRAPPSLLSGFQDKLEQSLQMRFPQHLH